MIFKFADTNEVSQYKQEISQIMSALGINSYLVTDESRISDFCPDKEDLAAISLFLAIPVSVSDFIHVLAKRLRNITIA